MLSIYYTSNEEERKLGSSQPPEYLLPQILKKGGNENMFKDMLSSLRDLPGRYPKDLAADIESGKLDVRALLFPKSSTSNCFDGSDLKESDSFKSLTPFNMYLRNLDTIERIKAYKRSISF